MNLNLNYIKQANDNNEIIKEIFTEMKLKMDNSISGTKIKSPKVSFKYLP